MSPEMGTPPPAKVWPRKGTLEGQDKEENTNPPILEGFVRHPGGARTGPYESRVGPAGSRQARGEGKGNERHPGEMNPELGDIPEVHTCTQNLTP